MKKRLPDLSAIRRIDRCHYPQMPNLLRTDTPTPVGGKQAGRWVARARTDPEQAPRAGGGSPGGLAGSPSCPRPGPQQPTLAGRAANEGARVVAVPVRPLLPAGRQAEAPPPAYGLPGPSASPP